MLDDLLTSCALVLVALGVATVAAEAFEAMTPPAPTAVAAEVIQLPTVVVTVRRDTTAPADLVAAAGY